MKNYYKMITLNLDKGRIVEKLSLKLITQLIQQKKFKKHNNRIRNIMCYDDNKLSFACINNNYFKVV